MVSKKHEAIVFYLLLTSILALVAVSISFKYYFPDETFLFEDSGTILATETITYNGTLFDVPEHIYKINLTNCTALSDPLLAANLRVIINENYTKTLNGPEDYMVYNEVFDGKITELVLTDAGLSVSFNIEFSALRDRNPIYISLSVVSCVLALYYFYVTVNMRKTKNKNAAEEIKNKPES